MNQLESHQKPFRPRNLWCPRPCLGSWRQRSPPTLSLPTRHLWNKNSRYQRWWKTKWILSLVTAGLLLYLRSRLLSLLNRSRRLVLGRLSGILKYTKESKHQTWNDLRNAPGLPWGSFFFEKSSNLLAALRTSSRCNPHWTWINNSHLALFFLTSHPSANGAEDAFFRTLWGSRLFQRGLRIDGRVLNSWSSFLQSLLHVCRNTIYVIIKLVGNNKSDKKKKDLPRPSSVTVDQADPADFCRSSSSEVSAPAHNNINTLWLFPN